MKETDFICANKLILKHFGWAAGVIYHRVQYLSKKADDGWHVNTSEPLWVTLDIAERTYRRSLEALTKAGILEVQRGQSNSAIRPLVMPENLAEFIESPTCQSGRSQHAKVAGPTCQSGRSQHAKMAGPTCQSGRKAHSGTRVRRATKLKEELTKLESPHNPPGGTVAQPAPSAAVDLGSLESIFAEAQRRQTLPKTDDEHQQSLPFQYHQIYHAVSEECWKEHHVWRKRFKSPIWNYTAAKNLLKLLVRATSESNFGRPPRTQEQITEFLEHYIMGVKPFRITIDWVYKRPYHERDSAPKQKKPTLQQLAEERKQLPNLRLVHEG